MELSKVVTRFFALILVVLMAAPSYGQGDQMAQNGGALSGPRKQLSIIIFSGLAGAVLGLSTLSFYGRPQEKLSNIAIGAAIGIIGGASFTTYKAATEPYETFDMGAGIIGDELQFASALPEVWTPKISYQWDF